jgi:FdhD protein
VLREIGKTLEIALEKEIEIIVNGRSYKRFCTPVMLKELAVGFLVAEGVARSLEEIKVDVQGEKVVAEVPSSKQFLNERSLNLRPKYGRKFRIEELRKSLEILEIEEYRKTRGYHVSAVVSGNTFYRAYDVGRHNAVDKAIGLALLNFADLSNSFLLLSGRISKEIALKCANTGIPLVVSKAAILSSAIEFCLETGLSAVSFATNIAIGDAIE